VRPEEDRDGCASGEADGDVTSHATIRPRRPPPAPIVWHRHRPRELGPLRPARRKHALRSSSHEDVLEILAQLVEQVHCN
jgi:hypothetical protein